MARITLLTDFGTQDAYVGQMKGQMHCICPAAQLIDITHDVPPQDIEAGAFLLAQAIPFFPAGTFHLAVVDPGVGTQRRMIAADVVTRLDEQDPGRLQRIVLPDNGLISLLIEQHELAGATYLSEQSFWRPGFSHTFHGRDIMGPVIAHWANGAERSQFGPVCPVPVALTRPAPDFHQKSMLGRAVFVDHFGNVITNITAKQLLAWTNGARRLTVKIEERPALDLPLVATYGETPVGDLVLLIGSHGYLELARVGGSAAGYLAITNHANIRFTI